MRIRKRSMLPFSLSSPPRVASDLFSPRGGASVQKTAEAGEKEEDERVLRGPAGEGELGEGGYDRGSAFTLPGRRRSDNGPPFSGGGFCDRAEEEANRCCMLSAAPILAPVKAYRDADAEEEERCSARSDQKGCNSGRNGSLKPSGAETSTDGRWEEREKAIPLKKRKGSLEWGGGSGTAAAAHDQKQKKAKKTKITKRPTKKKAQDYDDDEDEGGKRGGGASGTTEEGEAITSVQGNKKLGSRRGSNGGLMEGSRCSRINGRGWRCCQQTLVGYSLCEHHLGKGRLRSMNSFPGRVSAGASHPAAVHDIAAGSIISVKSEAQTTAASSKSATKKKIGMVKARSISSLLGLSTAAILSTNNTTAAATAAVAAASSTASSAPATATASSS